MKKIHRSKSKVTWVIIFSYWLIYIDFSTVYYFSCAIKIIKIIYVDE